MFSMYGVAVGTRLIFNCFITTCRFGVLGGGGGGGGMWVKAYENAQHLQINLFGGQVGRVTKN